MKEYRETHKEYFKNYSKQYYQNNREKLIDRANAWQKTNLERARKNKRESARRHGKGNIKGDTRKCEICNKEFIAKSWKQKICGSRECQKEIRKREWEKVRALFDLKCIICGSDLKVQLHEVHGKDHSKLFFSYIRKHKEDFVPLCRKCHQAIHLLSKRKINKEELWRLLRLLKETH